MALPLRTPTPPPLPHKTDKSRPHRTREPGPDDFTGLDELDRPELDDAPDTDPMPALTALDWDSDAESGVKRRDGM